MIHDQLTHCQSYFHSPPWQHAFEFLTSLRPDSQDESHIALEGDRMYAAIMTYQTGQPWNSVLETHERYIDIHMSLNNSESIDWYPRCALHVSTQYDPTRERTLYHRPDVPAPARVFNLPGRFTVLFPQDAHMPKLMVHNSPERVKKVVVKVSMELWNRA